MTISFVRCGALCLVLGCGGNRIEVGPGGEQPSTLPAPLHGADDSSLPPWPAPNDCVSQTNLPMVGIWNGFFGRFTKADPDFRVDIRGASQAGGLCGTVTFKPTAPPLAPATNPDAMYPPTNTDNYNFGIVAPILNGFAFSLLNGLAQDERAHFEIGAKQAWEGWCELQSPYESPSRPYLCLPNWGVSGPWDFSSTTKTCAVNDGNGGNVKVNCGKAYLCLGADVCACNPARCTADNNGSIDATFELTLGATEGSGNVQGARADDVFLARAQ